MHQIQQRCLLLLSKTLHHQKLLLPLHTLLETSGLLNENSFLASELVRVNSLSSDTVDHARRLLYRLPRPPTAAWNHVIRGFARLGPSPRRKDSVEVFLLMGRHGKPFASPNELTFPFVLNAAAGLEDLHLGRQVHAETLKSGVGDVVYVCNALIFLYSCCGELGFARKMFDETPRWSLISWNSMLSGYAEFHCVGELLELFCKMERLGFAADEGTFVVMLSAAAETGNLGLGRWLHGRVITAGVVINVKLGTSLVDMYAKSGAVRSARDVFDRMRDRNVWTWSAMILGLAQHGLAIEAIDFFDKMKKTSDVEPNCVTFLGVLVACSHGGLVNEAHCVFREMVLDFRITARMEHYSAMVDVLGRNGRLEEAYVFVKSMPVEPDAVVWRTLLSACNIHKTTDSTGVGRLAMKSLMELEPKRTGNHVLVANMYAEAGLWKAAALTRKTMRGERMTKIPGESCIALGASVTRFVSNSDTHRGDEELCLLLDSLSLHIRTDASISSL